MATPTNYISSFTQFEVKHRKNNETISYIEDFQTRKQLNAIKPPRILSPARSPSTTELELNMEPANLKYPPHGNSLFKPVFRSGSCSEIGPKPCNEDAHICIDNIVEHVHEHQNLLPCGGAFYGVFDGHGGTDAALFIRDNILRFIIEDSDFSVCIQKAIRNAFLKADLAFLHSGCFDTSSGTTALTAIIIGRRLIIANAGDCRAVLSRRGRAIELSNDHKPNRPSERARIERFGGVVHVGYLNGRLSVSRALGDWVMKRVDEPGSCALSAEPEVIETTLAEEDEFLIMGCDGLWDVMSSERAVEIARRELMARNDPEMCSRELVREALKRNTCDNLTVVVVCFSAHPPTMIHIPKLKFKA